jgi:ribosomal protein S18 acetylase RimI-like enzyme
MGSRVRLRGCEPGDREFLLAVFASTRTEELALLPDSDEARRAFVAMQYEAQDRHYRQFCAESAFSIVMEGDQPVGRVVLHKEAGAMTLVDIAILPEFRGRGIGTSLLEGLKGEAKESGVPIRCHVDPDGAALRLYERLGFVVTGRDGHLLAMECR